MTSGSFTVNTSAPTLYLIVEWAETAVNTTANTSTVSVTMKLHHGGLSLGSGTDDCEITFNGTTQAWTGPDIYQSGENTVTLGTKTFIVTHGTDGKFSGTLTVSYRFNATYSGTYIYKITGSDTVTLTAIPRGIVYIDNGSSLEQYQVYIDNGSSWDLYIPYIDTGSAWEQY